MKSAAIASASSLSTSNRLLSLVSSSVVIALEASFTDGRRARVFSASASVTTGTMTSACEDALVVLEHDPAVLGDARVGREDDRHVDVTVLERRLGVGSREVERLEVRRQVDAVGLLETRECSRRWSGSPGARRAGTSCRAAEMLVTLFDSDVSLVTTSELVSTALAGSRATRSLRSRAASGGPSTVAATSLRGLAGVAVEELEAARGVLGIEVGVAGVDRGVDGGAVLERLVRDLEALGLEHLAVDLAERSRSHRRPGWRS